ncbi:MAG: hypothetical protein CMO66_07390 [Verrucomicrobiales bacterium]|nr:hypothetical protein [Verrucomicrobiales bacterium]
MHALLAALILGGSGCISSRELPEAGQPGDARLMVPTVADPLEPINRFSFAIHEIAFHLAVNPATKLYTGVVPSPARKGIRNFRNNLFFPMRFVSSLLQGKFSEAGTETKRFLINSTLGIGGLGDPAAKHFNLRAGNEELGQVLGKWGWQSQLYLYLPLIGPSSERDALGEAGNVFLDPASLLPGAKMAMAYNRFSFNARTIDQTLATEYDAYEMYRLLYSASRDAAVRDAQPEGSGEDTGQVQTLMSIYAQPKAEGFGGRAITRYVKPAGFRNRVHYSYWAQDGPAPLMYVLPGLGGHRLGTRALAIAEMAYAEGYQVVCVSNNFNWEFVTSAPEGYLPGYTPRDIDLLGQVHAAIQTDLGAASIKSTSLIGFSMGGWYTLNLAAGNPNAHVHAVAINPPLDLIHGMEVLDRLYRAPLAGDVDPEVIRQSALVKVFLNQQTGAEVGQQMPFTDKEASYLIGLSYRLTLRQAILSGKYHESLWPLVPRAKLYKKINELSYADYHAKLLGPSLVGEGVTAATLAAASDLRNQSDTLAQAGNLHLFLTSNDFLLTPEHLTWLRNHFPNRHTYQENGGHMGHLWKQGVRAQIRAEIKIPQVE